jgi:hypothetical protein
MPNSICATLIKANLSNARWFSADSRQ